LTFNARQRAAIKRWMGQAVPLKGVYFRSVEYMRMLVKDLSIMDMTESPIVVSLGDEFIEATRSIVLVARLAPQRRVQDSDIEHAGHGIGIAGHEVVGDIALPEALAVQRDLEFIENKGLSLAGREGIHIVRETQALCDLTFCIVIAI